MRICSASVWTLVCVAARLRRISLITSREVTISTSTKGARIASAIRKLRKSIR